MAPIDTAFIEKPTARDDASWDLDAPWILDPPSRLSFPPRESTRRSRFLLWIRAALSIFRP